MYRTFVGVQHMSVDALTPGVADRVPSVRADFLELELLAIRSAAEYRSALRAARWQRIRIAKPRVAPIRRRLTDEQLQQKRIRQRLFRRLHRLELTEQARERRTREPEKYLARSILQTAIVAGEIRKPSFCERCRRSHRSIDIHGHHRDYSRPLAVEWLCRWCHASAHRAKP
jgi:hypothetical protein